MGFARKAIQYVNVLNVALGKRTSALLEGSHSLVRLNLSHTRLGADGAIALATALANSPSESLQELGLQACSLGPAGCGAVVRSFRGTRLAITEEPIGDAEAAAIGEAMAEKPYSVRDLDLSRGEIGPRGAKALVSGAFRHGVGLHTLSLDFHGTLGDEGMQAMVEGGIAKPPACLQELSFKKCNVTSAGADSLRLAEPPCLSYVCCWYNHYQEKANVPPGCPWVGVENNFSKPTPESYGDSKLRQACEKTEEDLKVLLDIGGSTDAEAVKGAIGSHPCRVAAVKKEKKTRTVLHACAESGSVAVTEIVLRNLKKADPDGVILAAACAARHQGRTPLNVARERANGKGVADLILQYSPAKILSLRTELREGSLLHVSAVGLNGDELAAVSIPDDDKATVRLAIAKLEEALREIECVANFVSPDGQALDSVAAGELLKQVVPPHRP